jgi:hypothetical protein
MCESKVGINHNPVTKESEKRRKERRHTWIRNRECGNQRGETDCCVRQQLTWKSQ